MTSPIDQLTAALADRYVIERELGAGGMATVYLAHDLKHDRKVAVKVLRPELTAILGGQRFLNEIKVTANLQHPNILPLFDSGDADGLLYYVMPLIEGETLRDKLNRETQLSIEETLAITKSVAAALQYAHEHNVVHRDIKPENILLQSGQALVADFGIALAVSEADGTRITETGLSIGTPNYMSPEQAMGEREITPKSDDYSLGCIAFEMLVGEPPFTGPTAQAIVAKVLMDRSRPIRELRPSVPAQMETAVQKALQKLPADRFESTAAFAAAFADVGYRSTTMPSAVPSVAASRWWKAAAVGMITVAAVAAIVALSRNYKSGVGGGPLTQTPLTRTGNSFHPALSPDGQFLAYVTNDSVLMLSEADGGGARILVDNAAILNFPRFSPDGRDILFAAIFGDPYGTFAGGLFTVPRLGGQPRLVRTFEAPHWVEHGGFAYNPGGTAIVATGKVDGTVDVVDLATLHSRAVRLDQGIDQIWRFDWSADGRWIGFMGMAAGSEVLGIMDTAGTVTAKEAFAGPAIQVRWSPNGGALYYFQPDDEWDFMARRVDRRTGSFRGAAEVLIANVMNSGGPSGGSFDIDGTGTRMTYAVEDKRHAIGTFNASREPQFQQITQGTGWFSPPAISPDGKTVAYPRIDHLGINIYRQPFDGGMETAVTSLEGDKGNMTPTWSPDGGRVAFKAFSDTATARLVTVTVPGGQVDRPPFPGWPEKEAAEVRFLSENRLLVSGPQGPGAYDLSDGSYLPLNLPDSLLRYLYHPWPTSTGVALFSGDRFVSADSAGGIYLGDTRAGVVRRVAQFDGDEWPIGWTDGGDIHLANHRGRIWRVSETGGAPKIVALSPDPNVQCKSVSRDGRRWACSVVVSQTWDLWSVSDFDPKR